MYQGEWVSLWTHEPKVTKMYSTFFPKHCLQYGVLAAKNKISLSVFPGSGHARCLCFTTLSAPRARFVSTKRRTTSSNPVNYNGFCTSGQVPPPPARKSFGNRPKTFTQNKTKQNAARMPSGNRPDLTKNQPRFVLLPREIDHFRGFLTWSPERSD